MMLKGSQVCQYRVGFVANLKYLSEIGSESYSYITGPFTSCAFHGAASKTPSKMWCDTFHLIFAQAELHFNNYFKPGKSNRVNVHITEKSYQVSPSLPL